MKWVRNIFVLVLLAFVTIGFRLRNVSQSWDISPSDPYLWLKPCNPDEVISNNDVKSDDPLYGQTDVTVQEALESVIDQVNSIYGSYLRLEMYPDDPSSPPAGSSFDLSKAKTRTIEVCYGSQGGLGAGQAVDEIEGDRLVGCEALYVKGELKTLRRFLWIASHEIGHCLKLEHPQDLTDAVMSYYSDRDEIYRYQNDDINGLRYVYPADGFDLNETSTFGLSCAQRN